MGQVRRRAATLLLGFAAGCFPPEISEEGRRCAEDRPCTSPLVCHQSLCTDPDAVQENVLFNSDFEEGDPPTGWVTTQATLTVEPERLKSGTRAVRLEPTALPRGVARLLPERERRAVPEPQAFYCASVWIFLPADTLGARLDIREFNANNTFIGAINDVTRVIGEWTLLKVGPFFTQGGDALEARLELSTTASSYPASSYLLADDLRLWKSLGGKCL